MMTLNTIHDSGADNKHSDNDCDAEGTQDTNKWRKWELKGMRLVSKDDTCSWCIKLAFLAKTKAGGPSFLDWKILCL